MKSNGIKSKTKTNNISVTSFPSYEGKCNSTLFHKTAHACTLHESVAIQDEVTDIITDVC